MWRLGSFLPVGACILLVNLVVWWLRFPLPVPVSPRPLPPPFTGVFLLVLVRTLDAQHSVSDVWLSPWPGKGVGLKGMGFRVLCGSV